jgi:hypothetical protein
MGHKDDKIGKLTNEFVIRLAQLYVVSRCKCSPLKIYHSASHLDCFSVDEWLIDEFRDGAKAFAKQVKECNRG